MNSGSALRAQQQEDERLADLAMVEWRATRRKALIKPTDGWRHVKTGKIHHFDSSVSAAFLIEMGLRPMHEAAEDFVDVHRTDAPEHGGVYFILSMAPTDVRRMKIGWSKDNIAKRLGDIRDNNPWDVVFIANIPLVPMSVEKVLHRRFTRLRRKGEWFDFEGDLEAYVRRLRLGESVVDGERELLLRAVSEAAPENGALK